jgi:hypothetical protein
MAPDQAIVSLVALFDDGCHAVRPDGLVANVDYTAWAWVHLLAAHGGELRRPA